MLRTGNKFNIVNRQPDNMDERLLLATECVTEYNFTIPMVIDDLDQKVARDYKTRYVRTTIVDVDGKVAYYAGPGPFDFKLNKIERTIKKLIANNGHMPPPPEPQFGAENNGMRLGISIDPFNLKVGDDVLAQLRFENISDQTLYLLYQPNQAKENLTIKSTNGQIITIQPPAPKSQMDRMMSSMGRSGSQRIRPGEFYVGEFEGKVTAINQDVDVDPGIYTAVSSYQITEEDLAQMRRRSSTQTVWTGKLTSGMCVLDVAEAAKATCIDCHSRSDYHHSDFQVENCNTCHIGDTGSEDFTTNPDACGSCHPRAAEESFGRRQIMGDGGEFSMISKHIAGEITSNNCVLCHDTSQHQKGNVILKVDGNTETLTTPAGASSAFCLTCHDGSPPADVTFPKNVKGSGYDKSNSTMNSALGQQGPTCALCHNSHGSTLPSLLRDVHKRR